MALALALAVAFSFQDQEPQPGKKQKPRNLVGLPEDYVRFVRVPEGGVQPRVLLDAGGVLHLFYLKGEGGAGDLHACRSSDQGQTFSPPLRVNGREGSVAAPEGRPDAYFALGPSGREHAVWVGSEPERPLYYTQSRPDGDGFEPERSLLPRTAGLGRGPAVAVDAEGRVYVYYAAYDPDVPSEEGIEPPARIFLLRSRDGSSFTEPVSIDNEKHGVSLQSELAAEIGANGTVYLLCRVATDFKKDGESKARARDVRLLSSTDGGDTFDKAVLVGNWRIQRDPRGTGCLFESPNAMLAAWMTDGQVFWSYVLDESRTIAPPLEPKRGRENFTRSRPALSSNKGEVCLVWIERPIGEPGAEARITWQVWEKLRKLPLGNGQAPEPAGKSAPAVFTRPGGGFTIVY